jgi:hypothetical protein
MYILYVSDNQHIRFNGQILQNLLAEKELHIQQKEQLSEDIETANYRLTCLQNISQRKPGGVVLLLLTTKSVSYFSSLSFKIDNILQNIPLDWIIQIFYQNSETFQQSLEDNPGMRRQFADNKRIFPQEIPKKRQLTMIDQHEHYYRLQPWLWKSLLAENVLVVDGKLTRVFIHVISPTTTQCQHRILHHSLN